MITFVPSTEKWDEGKEQVEETSEMSIGDNKV